MKPALYRNLQELLVFFSLVSIGVAGRWGQPTWCFTPTAAVAIFAGWYFTRLTIAALVPIAVLAISDQMLPAYNDIPVLLTTYGTMTLPIMLGRWQRRSQSWAVAAVRWATSAILPATLFYLITNFAVWASYSTYEKSLAGLVQCYWAAVPFYRTMLAGDAFYLCVLLMCAAAAGVRELVRQRTNLEAVPVDQ